MKNTNRLIQLSFDFPDFDILAVPVKNKPVSISVLRPKKPKNLKSKNLIKKPKSKL